ncbi:calponin homology domain-containing protein DDB_G0272472 [Battus philenor]|uniref:calponin homology domain-containing protein DDB_G0272472 n=1 Tax=Battus philenor TaxID=42288 RepID=UPI0035CEEF88
MEEVRQLVQEEGREARNLVAFHVAVDTPSRVSRRPPRAAPPPRRAPPRAARLRSASAGRDKRSELRARYWALLFGDLQRAVGEIYNTVEAHENLNECQEVILVLENYTRDFKALGEWFRLKWEYDNTPPPQRPQSLAWEIRKTDFVRPESRRTHSVKSSPSVSGKNSPCLSGHNTPSGKNSPNLTGKASPGSGKISPRISTCHSSTSPKANIEFFTNKMVISKITTKPEPKSAKESTRLSDIKEKDVKESDDNGVKQSDDIDPKETGKAKEQPSGSAKHVVIKSPKSVKPKSENTERSSDVQLSSQAIATISQLEAMENELLAKQLTTVKAKNENFLNEEKELEIKNKDKLYFENTNSLISQIDANDCLSTESPTKSEENFADISNESSPKSSIHKSDISSQHMIAKSDSIDEVTELIEDTTDNDISNSPDPFTTIKQQPEINTPQDKQIESHAETFEESESITVDVTSGVILETDKKQDLRPDATNESNFGKADAFDMDPTKGTDFKVNGEVQKSITDICKNQIITNNNIEEQINEEESKVTKKIINEKCVDNDAKVFNGTDSPVKESQQIKKLQSETKEEMRKEQDLKKLDSKPAVDSKINTKPAYSQAAAKPKPATTIKTEIKTPTRTALVRSSTVVEMRPNTAPKTARPFQKRNQTNKCSYPFNLTTSRTSLFDTPGSNNANRMPLSKRPINRNMGSGDGKGTPNKVDPKKRPPRPTTLKVNGKGDKKENTNTPLDKIKDCDEYSSCDTLVTQIDMSRIESSESLKTLVSEEANLHDVANSIEVLNVDSNKNDNEGWLTVKSKRLSRESKKQSKSHWANRFRQPSATTSLPTLNMLESPKEETAVVVQTPKAEKTDRAKSEQPEKIVQTEQQVEKVVKVIPAPKDTSKTRDPSMIRQKSDVTGLKTKSSKNKVLTKKAEKIKDTSNEEDTELTKNRLHSSLESLTTGLERSQESTEEPFDFDKWKAEFKSTFKYLDDDDQIPNQTEILKTADPTEMSEIAEMTSQIEENEKKIGWALDFQSEVDQRKLCEEEDSLNRQIMELQQVSDIDVDTETDDTETDAEIPSEEVVNPPSAPSENLGSLAASLENQYETALAGMTWAERVDTLVVLEALVARDPGRAQQLHAKLSQGIKRRGSLQDALRRLQAKQARAERQRQEYQTERAKRIHQLLARVEEVKIAKNQLIEEKRLRMERRLKKAAENRDQYLKDIVKKAHDEDEKLREIAFIKQLQAQNRRHDFLAQCRYHTTRLRQMRRERLRKLEEKTAREAAVGARRQALEEARRSRVETLVQRRRLRDERVQGMRELRRQERGDAAREKAEGVKSRLSALAAAAEQEVDALRSRIRDKQDASQQRLEQHLQAVREKATGPRQPTTSESHEPPNNEQEEAERLEQERKEREKQKNIKKKARKLRQKLLATGNENPVYDDHSSSHEPFGVPFANKMYKVIQQISSIVMPLCRETPDAKPCVNGLDFDEKPKKHKNKKSKATNGDIEHEDKKKSKKGKEKNGIENNNNTEEIAEEKVEGKKKKKKNRDGDNEKNGKDRPKLNKAPSICSSQSDTSRSSKKCEVRVCAAFDNLLLERQLNELYRMMEKFDKLYPDRQIIPEKVTIQKMQGLKVIGHMLALASEREDLAPHFTTKSLCTAVALVSRAASACNALGAFLLSTNATVHIATLLQATLEKDLHSDPKEMELARHLSDCLSVALDSVLCSSRVHDDQPRLDEDLELLGTLRNRAHLIISYLCLSGCIARAEHAGQARESVQTLLTVCADLCHPCDADVGSERSSAKQSLRCALGTGMCGSRAEFCMLFAKGADLGHCGTFVRAARTAHLLRALAEMDHLIVQEAFGEGGWPLEFRAAVARLLSQHAPNDKEAPRTPTYRKGGNNMRLDQTLSETMVLDLIVLVGFVVVNNPQLQETICEGWSVIKTLCTLPANWLVSPPHSHALLPTLVALADRPATAAAIAAEFSVQMLNEYMQSPEAQKVKLVQVIKQGRNKKGSGKNKNNSEKQSNGLPAGHAS